MRVIASTRMPPIGPYSTGISIPAGSELVFFSGVIPSVTDRTFIEEVESVFDNLTALLDESGLTLEDIVDVQAFIVNLPDHAAPFNDVYRTRMSEPYPARATIGVAALPKDMRVELKVTAVRTPSGTGSCAVGGEPCAGGSGPRWANNEGCE